MILSLLLLGREHPLRRYGEVERMGLVIEAWGDVFLRLEPCNNEMIYGLEPKHCILIRMLEVMLPTTIQFSEISSIITA